jgi:glycerol kinase
MSSTRHIVIGIDVGTTNVKAVALDEQGNSLAEGSLPIATAAPRPGWVEQDPESMIAKAVDCVRHVLTETGRGAADVAGLGIANHTETLVIWDRRLGRSVMPAIVWQCRRGAAEIESLRSPDMLSLLKSRTGLDLDPTFTAAKLKWVFVNRPEIAEGLRAGDLLFGTVDTWLIWSLTGGQCYATEPGNASRTMLFDIDRVRFDPELLSLFSLDMARLPESRASNASFGSTEASLFGAPIPIHAALGDQQASLFGHGCFDAMQTKITYGTGAFLWVNAGPEPRDAPGAGIIRTIGWQIDRLCYAYEGFVMYAGRTLEWLAQRLAIDGDAAGVAVEAEKERTSDGVRLVPAFQGLASPWWEPGVRAALIGMSEATSNGNIAHAGLEAVCYQIRAVLDVIRDAGRGELPEIKVDGGMTRSAYFMQLQADVLQLPLHVSASNSVAAIGAALMAGLGTGVWGSLDDLRGIVRDAGTIMPDPEAAVALDRSYAEWLAAVSMLTAQYGRQA